MRKLQKISIAFLVALALLAPAAARAEMGHHHEEGSHERHGGQHHEMEKNTHMMGVDAVFDNYFVIQSALAADSMDGVSAKAEAIAEAVEGKHGEAMKGGHAHGAGMHVLMNGIASSAKSLSKKSDIDSAREEFGALSEKMIKYYESLDDDKDGVKAHVFTCGMAKKSWLQKDEDTRNPYFGSSMLKCGRKIK